MLNHAAGLLFDHSLFNAHPRFWGYVTSSAAPIGALGELLAAAVNPNCGAWLLSPMASEIEAQTIRWIAEMLNYPTDCGGLFVSGGNMANIVCFLAARQAKAGSDVRSKGVEGARLRAYCSKETHTWIQKAADIAGLGTDSVRWIAADNEMRIDLKALRAQIRDDIAAGDKPFLVIGNAGTVSTGAMDPLPELAALCREFDLWFHVDGAYGGFAAVVPDAPAEFAGLSEADSIAVDPHKWLYAPTRGRLRPGARCVETARCICVSPALLSLRRRGHQLFRSRSAELARLSCAQGVARAATGRAAMATCR